MVVGALVVPVAPLEVVWFMLLVGTPPVPVLVKLGTTTVVVAEPVEDPLAV